MPRLRKLTILLALSLLGACHDEEGSLPLGELREKALDAVCDYTTQCEGFPSVASCKTSTFRTTDQLIAAVNAGRIKYDGKAAAACLDVLRATGCNRTDSPAEGPLPCAETFKGTLPAGTTCNVNEECVSGICTDIYCTSTSACCTGTCEDSPAAVNPVSVGGNCRAANAVCAQGSYCNQSGTTSICAVGPAVGQPCDPAEITTGRCLNHAVCVAPSGGALGTCTPPPAEGQTCDPNGPACNSSLDYCDSSSGKCVRRLAPGMACPNGDECVGYASCVSGTCVALQQVGAPCEEGATVATCLGSLECSFGICEMPVGAPVCF